VNWDWTSLPARCMLDFVGQALEVGYDLVTTTAVSRVIDKMARSPYLIFGNNLSVFSEFCLCMLPRINALQLADGVRILERIAQQFRARKAGDKASAEQCCDIDGLLQEFDSALAVINEAEMSSAANKGDQSVSAPQASRPEGPEVSAQNVSMIERIRHINIEDLETHFADPDARSGSQNTHDGEDAADSHSTPSQPGTPNKLPKPQTHSAYIAPTPYTREERSRAQQFHSLGDRQWRRKLDPVGVARTTFDFSILNKESIWGCRSVAYLIEAVCSRTTIDMSYSDENAAYSMFTTMVAADNLLENMNLQTLGIALFPKASILDTMADRDQSRRLTTLLEKLFDRGHEGTAAQRRYIQGLCNTMERDFKYPSELLKDEGEEGKTKRD
jgi:hypothetical protein